MNHYLSLFKLDWLTGHDGRVSFSKLVLVVLMGMLGVLIFHVVDSPDLVQSLWPMVWMFALLLAGSYGLKGLSLWFGAAKLRTEARSVAVALSGRRDQDEGIEPS